MPLYCTVGKVSSVKKLAGQNSGARSSAKKLDPMLKSWLDEVIIPALVRVYLDDLRKQKRLESTGSMELLSDIDGDKL